VYVRRIGMCRVPWKNPARFGGKRTFDVDVAFFQHVLISFHIYIKRIKPNYHWIGLRENLQETMVFTIKYGVFL
jgi:hypothetical protein